MLNILAKYITENPCCCALNLYDELQQFWDSEYFKYACDVPYEWIFSVTYTDVTNNGHVTFDNKLVKNISRRKHPFILILKITKHGTSEKIR